MAIDYEHCGVCGIELGPDKMHVLIDNAHVTRHVYCCRKHRYVVVNLSDKRVPPQVQMRSDLEIESLAFAFRSGGLKPGWE